MDVSGSVTVAAQSDYIYTTPSLHIDNTSRDDSTGASIKLTGRRNFRSENVSNSGYPYTTGADIIFENYNDAKHANAAKKETIKIHGVIKTFQTDNSWNIGDMGFYGQDISSLYTGTDTSGITEFMRFDASSQFVRFSKDVGIGGVKGEVVNMTLVSPTHALPQYPDPSAVLDLRTYTYYGQTGRSQQPGWKGGNILLAPENKTSNNNLGTPNGLIWKPLAGEITGSNFDYNYTKESAGIKFMPAANFYRGGLAFFTNNTADVSTNAVERMRIDQSGNVGIGTSSPSSTLDVSGDLKVTGDLSVQGQSTFNSNATMNYGASLLLKNQNSASANISVDSNNILKISNSEGVSIPSDVKGNLTLTTGYLSRDTPDSSGTDVPHGYLVGNYLSEASGVGKKSYPIFALDDNLFKQSSHTSLGDFYGIGYTQNNNTFISAGDPSSNWGMYVSAEGKVGSFIDGGQGADSFFNPEGGKVGIGTKGPSQKLDVNGNILANSYLIDNTKGIFGGPGNAQLLLSVNGAQNPALRVLSNSNIAIGHDDGAPSLLTIGNSINSNSSHDSTAFDSGTKILLGNQGSNTTGEDGSYYVIGFGAFESSIVNSPAGKYPAAYIGYQQQDYTDQTGYGDLVFGTKDNTGKAGTEAKERMRIVSNGYVGIGTNSPNAKLEIIGDTGNRPLAIENKTVYPSILCRGNAIATDSYNYFLNGTVPGTAGYVQTGAVHFINGPQRDADNGALTYTIRNDSGDLALGGKYNEAPGIYIVRESHNVGIGTSNPSAALSVAGSGPSYDVGINMGIDGFKNAGLVLVADEVLPGSGGQSYIDFNWKGSPMNGANGRILYTSNGMSFYTQYTLDQSARMTIDNQGNVGIQGNLTVNGTNLTSLISNSHGSQGYALLDGTLPFTGTVTAPSFNATSDVNKKEDIETISGATEKLTSLRGVSYKLKEDEEKKTHYGVVAQEIEKVFPDMVHGEEGNKSVAYMEIIGVLIETVKDLNKRIKKLEESS